MLAILLGVPQGSVLGPLLFIIFINDLSYYLISILTKHFADDTTLIFANNDLDSVISSLRLGLCELNEWCKHINWSKTFIMIISNKRFIKPVFIEYNHVKIEVSSSFKLLGILIDDKLNFQAYVAQQCLNIKFF